MYTVRLSNDWQAKKATIMQAYSLFVHDVRLYGDSSEANVRRGSMDNGRVYSGKIREAK